MVLNFITSLIYLYVASVYLMNLWTSRNVLLKSVNYILITGAIFHLISVLLIIKSGYRDIFQIDNLLYVFSLLIILVFIVYQFNVKSHVLGALLFPLVFLLTLPSVVLPPDLATSLRTPNNYLVLVHVLVTFLGQAVFTIAFLAGLLYLFEENRIKNKKVNKLLKKFPSLTSLDNINFYSLIIGFPILTIGLALGIVISKHMWGVLLRWHQKEIWAVITWVLYALLIYSRIGLGFKGKKSAIGAIIGFAVIILTFVALGYLPE